jgi:hypothetical protein
MVYPPGYRFLHNLPNKPLTGHSICKILTTKDIISKIFKTLGLWCVQSLERHKPEAVGFCLYLVQVYTVCQGIRRLTPWIINGW